MSVNLSAKTNVFSPDRITFECEPGLTIRGMLDAADYHPPEWAMPVCIVNDQVVLEGEWEEVVPTDGDLVQISIMPKGGTATKQLIITFFVLAVVTIVTAGTGTPIAGALAGSVAGVGLTYLTAPPKPKQIDVAQGNTVTGQSNQITRDTVIPKVYGKIRVTPNHGALPFTEVQGDDLYIRMLLCPGHGPLNISDIRIGDTPISVFGSDVEVEIREGRPTDAPLKLFSQDFFEEAPNIEVKKSSGDIIRTTRPDTDEITVDLTFPNGIFKTNKNGNTNPTTVQFTIEYADTGTNAFIPFPDGGPFVLETERAGTIRRTFRVVPPNPGHFDVRVRRITGDKPPGSSTVSDAIWTAMRSIAYQDPLPHPNLAKVALRIKRDGNVDGVNMLCHSYLPDYNGVGWVEALTSNPASIYRDILTGNGNARPISSARLREDEDLVPWHNYCATEGFEFNEVFDNEGTVRDRLALVTSAGRAFFSRPDGRFGVGIDELKTTPVALLTSRNSRNFQGTREHVETLHAVRVLFKNEEKSFEEDERVVFADAQDEFNSDPGRIEVLDFRNSGVTNPETIWRHGRFFLAQARLRQERWTIDVSLQHIILTRGDLVRIQNDILLSGQQVAARVKSVVTDGGGNVTSATFDDIVTMEAGNNYAIQGQVVDSSGQPQVVNAAVDFVLGDHTTVTFTTPIPSTQALFSGDLISFGIAGLETINAVITEVRPGDDYTAQLTLVHAAPEIHDADTGVIPVFQSNITLPGDFFGIPPETPVISRIYLEQVNTPVQPDSVHGATIVIDLDRSSDSKQPPEFYKVRIRIQGQAEFSNQHVFPGDSARLSLPPSQVDKTYEIQVKALGRSPAGVPNESSYSAIFAINVPKPDSTTADIPQIVGLELFNQANSTQFAGRDPQFVWRLTAGLGSFSFEGSRVEAFSDPALSHYEVRIFNVDGTTERRIESIAVPQYTYRYEDNLEDAKRLNRELGTPVVPARDFIISVKIIDTFGREGPERILRVANPSPATPAGLSIQGGIGQVFVAAEAPVDPDFRGIKVWASTVSGFVPDDSTNLAARALQDHVTFASTSGSTLFVRAAFFDVFSDDIPSLNISSEFSVTIQSVDAIPDFTFEDILFSPNDPAVNEVSWTAGTATTLVNGLATPEAVAAGSAVYPGAGSLFLYYVGGSGQIFATTDPAQAASTNARVLSIYKGGTSLTSGNGDVLIDGSTIAAGTIVGQAIAGGSVTGDLLAGENLIVNSAQIGNLTVETSNIADLAINKITTSSTNASTGGFTADNVFFTVQSRSVQTDGGKILVKVDFIFRMQEFADGGGEKEIEARIVRNGSTRKTVPLGFFIFTADTPNTQENYANIQHVDEGLSAGTYAYVVQLRYKGTHSSGNGLDARGRNLIIQEVKK